MILHFEIKRNQVYKVKLIKNTGKIEVYFTYEPETTKYRYTF